MKLRELIQLNEEETTVQGDVTRLNQLRDADGEFLAGVVNVTGNVLLDNLLLPRLLLPRLPVRFGTVDGIFSCSDNRLTTLKGAPSTVGRYFFCNNNRLTSLVGVHRILRRVGGMLFIGGNPITSGGIGLILVEGLKKIDAKQPAFEIINKYLGQGKRGVLLCQEALHEAGLEEFARL